MASYWFKQTSLTVASFQENNAVIFYEIVVNVDDVQWSVLHRYNDFLELHNQLVMHHGISKDILPPKKVIRNKCPQFLETRRQALEEYLQYLLIYLRVTMPKVFVEFLHFNLYDVFYLVESMAEYFFQEGDKILAQRKEYAFNPLQVYAISECSAVPNVQVSQPCYDLSHVLDFCSQLKKVHLEGIPKLHINSNVCPNNLFVDFSAFKNLAVLEIVNCKLENFSSLGTLRNTLTSLSVHKSNMRNISEILQCDSLHKQCWNDTQIWKVLSYLDLSMNQISVIDESIRLVPKLETLKLCYNEITAISNLEKLNKLSNLLLSNNLIHTCSNWHMKLGNISTLDLSQNQLQSAKGLMKLYSLENLNLSSNKIVGIDEVSCIGDFPCLENLNLTGNPVSTMIDYRVKVLETFGERGRDICLDNEKPSQMEIDKVSVLRALRIVQEGRCPIISAM